MKGKILSIIFICIYFLTFGSQSAYGQRIYNLLITGNYENQAMPDIIEAMEKIHDVRIYYDPNKIPLYPVSINFEKLELHKALEKLLQGSNLVFTKYDDQSIVVTRYTKLNKENADRIVAAWKSGAFSSPTSPKPKEETITLGDPAERQNGRFEVSGKIFDEETREPVIGATIISGDIGAASDANGFFKLNVSAGTYKFAVDYIGYQSLKLTLNAFSSGQIELTLPVRTFQLQEVVVSAESAKAQLESTNVGVEMLSPKEIKKLPSFMGEADIVKSLELLPGVSTVGEGTSGFNVRGGSIDQNLILQDGGMIFNSSHALGIFSIFNPDAVKRVTLYKGNIPAQFGGRLSSVLDIELKDGNFTKYKGQGGIGLASSRLSIEGPILEGKLSFIAAGRTSYSDWMLKLIEAPDINQSSARFRDWSVRMSYQLSPETNIIGSAFSSYDFFRFARDFGYAWQTDLYQIKARHFFSEKLSGSLAAISGRYSSEFFDPEGFDAFDYSSGVRYYNLKPEFIYQINSDQQYLAGINYVRYENAPEQIDPRGVDSAIRSRKIEQEQGDEISAYINGDFKLNDFISISAGLRYTLFRQLGDGVSYNYQAGQPLNSETIVDSVRYGKNELIQQYSGVEPRVSANVKLSEKQSFKFSYNRMGQYIHLISNTAAATPADVWQMSTPNIKPQVSDNFSLGYFHNFKENEWVTSIEVYYKQLQNIVTYKDFPELLLQPQIETEIIQSEGRAYGVELSIARTLGKWNGRMSYTFARSLIRTQSDFQEEIINRGKWFPADFDQPHRVNLNLEWKMSATASMQFNFTFRSGRPISFPTEAYGIEEIVVSNFSPRNQYRIPAYHRFDWGINLDRSEAKRKGLRSSFTLSLYNLYARKNPFSFFFRRNDRGVQQAYKLSILGATFPSLTYNFVF